MPWDSNELKLAKLNKQGNILKTVIFNSEYFKFKGKISFFNPVWSEKGELYVAEDISGWGNITQIKTDINNISITIFQSISYHFFLFFCYLIM